MTLDFPFLPGAFQFRALRQRVEAMTGWDVYALQCALNACDAEPPLERDGGFGKETARAVRTFQRQRHLEPVDGIAGVMTQGKLVSVICRRLNGNGLPLGIPFGHCEHESSCWVGNYTAPYDNGSRDCGVVQRNTLYAKPVDAFDTPGAIQALSRQVLDAFARYSKLPETNDRRAWELACGSWNAPAYTDALARGQDYVLVGGRRIDLSLGSPERTRIERYMAAVTAYVRW